LSALINADPSGLEDEEYAQFCQWESNAVDMLKGISTQFHWDCDTDDYFGQDDVTGLWADVVDVRLVFKEKNYANN